MRLTFSPLKTLLLVTTIGLSWSGRAFCDPVKFTVAPPKNGYTEEKPSYLYFKEVEVTRVSSRELEFDITLQGEVPKDFPHDIGVGYSVFFDGGPYAFKNTAVVGAGGKVDPADMVFAGLIRKKGDFESDTLVAAYELPNARPIFKAWSWDSLQLGRDVWKFDMSQPRVQGDKISFSVKSGFFAELKFEGQPANIRMMLGIDQLRYEPRQNTSGKITKPYAVSATKVFPMPTREAAATPTPTPSIFDRATPTPTPAATP